MTALDQAFIKAFSQQAKTPAAATLQPASHEPREDRAAANGGSVQLKQSAVPSVAKTPGATDIAPEMFDRFDGILAALEKMPDLRTNEPVSHEPVSHEPVSQNADAVQAVDNAECHPIEFPSVEVDVCQWAGDAMQWTVGDESLSTTVESLLPGHEPQPSIPEPETAYPEPETPNVEYLPAAAELRAETHEPEEMRAELETTEIAEENEIAAESDDIPAEDVGLSCPLHRHREFHPAWQVDKFSWPKVCRRLMSRATDEWDRLADALANVAAEGNKVQAFAGCRQGEGATTLLLCAANRLAERGIKTALIDADFQRPKLAKRLGVQPQIGWNETETDEQHDINQAVVETADGNLGLAALREPDGAEPADWLHWRECVGRLREHYDVVLVDLGPLENCMKTANTPWDYCDNLDVVLLAHNRRITTKETLVEMQRRLNEFGVNVAGVVENFVTT